MKLTQTAPMPLVDPESGLSLLDDDILNNMSYLDDFDFDIDFNSDFDLYPANNNINLYDLPDLPFFPDLDLESSGPSPLPSHRHHCPHCPESFRRRCELTRHLLRHTQPFKCTQSGCGAAFAEKRRCTQHEKAVHGLATDKDLRKCHLCGYTSIRPDAVKRHVRLKHGVHVSFRSGTSTSPATTASGGQR